MNPQNIVIIILIIVIIVGSLVYYLSQNKDTEKGLIATISNENEKLLKDISEIGAINVIVTDQSFLYVSDNLINWAKVKVDLLTINKVEYKNNNWIVLGSGTNFNAFYSIDGKTWTGIPNSKIMNLKCVDHGFQINNGSLSNLEQVYELGGSGVTTQNNVQYILSFGRMQNFNNLEIDLNSPFDVCNDIKFIPNFGWIKAGNTISSPTNYNLLLNSTTSQNMLLNSNTTILQDITSICKYNNYIILGGLVSDKSTSIVRLNISNILSVVSEKTKNNNNVETNIFQDGICNVLYSKGNLILAGGNGKNCSIAKSIDGLSWTPIIDSQKLISNCRKIDYYAENNYWIACGSGLNNISTLMYSDDDGNTWKDIKDSKKLFFQCISFALKQ